MNINNKKLPKSFRFYECQVKRFLRKASYHEVFMMGFREELGNLKTSVLKAFDDVSGLTYGIECYGWIGDDAKNMRNIEDALVQRLLEIYLICQIGVGEIHVNSDEIKENI